MISRRDGLVALGALGLWGLATSLAGCLGRSAQPGALRRAPMPLHLDPLTDLVAAAGLTWMISARPAALWANASLVKAIEGALPAGALDTWPARLGGIDVRRAQALILAGFDETLLALARVPVEPGELEHAFARRATVEGRAADDHDVIRLFGALGADRAQLAILGREGVAFERGPLGPLRAAAYFAEGKLKRASPALRAPPLDDLARRIGDAPLLAFAPGPFEGEWASGAAGLLRGATAAAASASPVEGPYGSGLLVRLVLAGAWGRDALAGSERLAACFGVLGADATGHLLGLDRPRDEPVTRAEPDFIELEVVLDPHGLARGLRDATGASISEIIGS